MKRYKLLFLLINLILVFSCRDDEISMVSSGQMVEVDLNIGAVTETVVTRGVSQPKDEQTVHNLFVWVFNEQGGCEYQNFYDTIVNNRVQMSTLSGEGKIIYAIANVDSRMFSVTSTELWGIQSIQDIKTLNIELLQDVAMRGSNFVMIGEHAGVTINSQGIQLPNGQLSLNRLDAKITFNFRIKEGVSFTSKEWRVHQMSGIVNPFTDSIHTTSCTRYFKTLWENYEGSGEQIGRTFSFYTLPNHLRPRKSIQPEHGTSSEQYALREKQLKDVGGQNGAFEYANEQSTYVEFTGIISYVDTQGKEVAGDVSYKVHLGYVGADPNNYESLSNTHYTYTITINSVDNIIVEVETESENQPGASGDITIAGNIERYDAHYNISSIVFNRDCPDNLSWHVETPFSGTQLANQDDYKWMWFRLNAGKDKYADKNQSYTNSFVTDDTELYTLSIAQLRKKLLTVDQLVKLLNHRKNDFFKKNEIRFTVFVDEYYYERHPLTGVEDHQLWKQFVNRYDRSLSILSDRQLSLDGESSKTEAIVLYRQKAIQTMYNPDPKYTDLTNAWGLECICESGPLKYKDIDKTYSSQRNNADDKQNGLANTRFFTPKNVPWSDYVDDKGMLKMKFAQYACLTRNRDENGNGTIESEEIKWYLAAINQLTDMWIGEPSFDKVGALYQKTSWSRGKDQYYISSTVYNEVLIPFLYRDRPQVLWSAEGSSTGGYRGVEDVDGTTGTHYRNTNFYYRCVRNLGDKTKPNQDFVRVNGNMVDLSWLERKSIRVYYQDLELPAHHERSVHNQPYSKFEIKSGTYGRFQNWNSVETLLNHPGGGTSPCPSGYRVPNQRELAIMHSRVETGWTYDNIHLCATGFQWRDNMTPARSGFAVSGNNTTLFLTQSKSNERISAKVRCIRDISN